MFSKTVKSHPKGWALSIKIILCNWSNDPEYARLTGSVSMEMGDREARHGSSQSADFSHQTRDCQDADGA